MSSEFSVRHGGSAAASGPRTSVQADGRLLRAAEKGNLAEVKTALADGANVNAKDLVSYWSTGSCATLC